MADSLRGDHPDPAASWGSPRVAMARRGPQARPAARAAQPGTLPRWERYCVKETTLKSRHSLRTVDLSPSLVQTVLAHPAGDDPEADFVFRSRTGGPIDPGNVNRAFKRHLTAAE